MSHPCATGCGKTASATICSKCTDQLVVALRKLATGGTLRVRVHQLIVDGARVTHTRVDTRAGLYEDLIDTIARKDHTGGLGIGGHGARYEVDFHKKAAELKGVVDNEIGTWARDIAETYGRPLDATTIRQATTWLAHLPKLLAAHPAAGEMHHAITTLVRTVERVVDRKPDDVYLGQCGANTADGICEHDIYAPQGQPVVQCRGCANIWGVTERQDWLLKAAEDQLATSAEISKALSRLGREVTRSMIRGYAHRGKLDQHPPHPHDPYRQPRYRVGDVQAILDTTAAQEAS